MGQEQEIFLSITPDKLINEIKKKISIYNLDGKNEKERSPIFLDGFLRSFFIYSLHYNKIDFSLSLLENQKVTYWLRRYSNTIHRYSKHHQIMPEFLKSDISFWGYLNNHNIRLFKKIFHIYLNGIKTSKTYTETLTKFGFGIGNWTLNKNEKNHNQFIEDINRLLLINNKINPIKYIAKGFFTDLYAQQLYASYNQEDAVEAPDLSNFGCVFFDYLEAQELTPKFNWELLSVIENENNLNYTKAIIEKYGIEFYLKNILSKILQLFKNSDVITKTLSKDITEPHIAKTDYYVYSSLLYLEASHQMSPNFVIKNMKKTSITMRLPSCRSLLLSETLEKKIKPITATIKNIQKI